MLLVQSRLSGAHKWTPPVEHFPFRQNVCVLRTKATDRNRSGIRGKRTLQLTATPIALAREVVGVEGAEGNGHPCSTGDGRSS